MPSYSRKPVSDRLLMLKDLNAVSDLARARQAQLPLAAAALDVYRLAEKQGLLQRDLAALFELYPVTAP